MSVAMTAIRLIPLPIHAALRLATGLATMAAPFALGFSAAGAVVAVLVGALVVGVALSATPDERGRSTLPVSAVHAFDYGAAFGLLGAAAVLGVAGDAKAFVALAAIALVQLIGNLTTRYSGR